MRMDKVIAKNGDWYFIQNAKKATVISLAASADQELQIVKNWGSTEELTSLAPRD
jgi:hypothetical protein